MRAAVGRGLAANQRLQMSKIRLVAGVEELAKTMGLVSLSRVGDSMAMDSSNVWSRLMAWEQAKS
jgi:hypothetical protein